MAEESVYHDDHPDLLHDRIWAGIALYRILLSGNGHGDGSETGSGGQSGQYSSCSGYGHSISDLGDAVRPLRKKIHAGAGLYVCRNSHDSHGAGGQCAAVSSASSASGLFYGNCDGFYGFRIGEYPGRTYERFSGNAVRV